MTLRNSVLVITLGLAAVVSGCAAKSATVRNTSTVVAQSAQKPVKAVFLCSGITKTGKACRNHVKVDGARCHLHLNTNYKEAGLIVPCTTDSDCAKKNGGNGDPDSKN